MRTLYKKTQNNDDTLIKKNKKTMRTLYQLFMNLTLLQSLEDLCLF